MKKIIIILLFPSFCFGQTFEEGAVIAAEVVSDKTFIADTGLVIDAAFYYDQDSQIIDEASCKKGVSCGDYSALQQSRFQTVFPFVDNEVCYAGEKAEAIVLLKYNIIKFNWFSKEVSVFLSEDETSQIRLLLRSETLEGGGVVAEIGRCGL